MSDLYDKLAEAYARPSRGYRAFEAAADIPQKALEGYLAGGKVADTIRERRNKQKTLKEILGGQLPSGTEGYGDLTAEQFKPTAELLTGLGAIEKANREREAKPQRFQQGTFLVDGKLTRFDPITGTYETADAPGNAPGGRPGTITGNPTITPRVAPAVPGEQVSKISDMEKLLQDVPVVRSSYKPEFVGAIDAPLTALKQRTGFGATPEAATFGTTIAGMRNKVLNLLSGAAISPAEAQRLMQQLPNEQMSEVDFNSRVNNFERELRSQIDERKSGFDKAGYRSTGQSSSPSGPRSFNSPEEAEASGYKGPAIINGRRAVIH